MTPGPEHEAWATFTRHLFGQNRFAIKLGLERMQCALAELGLEPPGHRVVCVAGTNGKGTTASCLAEMLRAHGVRVGLYTSPHLIGLEERFRIDGVPASRALVLEIGQELLTRFGGPEADPRLTFFELTTAMAARIFSRARVDVAVYEVGLGGRLDAVNALEPDVSVITTIGFDHQEYLGETIEEITAEKLGIARAGRPLIVGAQEHESAWSVLEAAPVGRLYRAARAFGHEPGPGRLWVELGSEEQRLSWTPASWGVLRADYQRGHAATAAAAAVALLKQEEMEPRVEALNLALQQVRWPGRLEHRALEVEGHRVPFLLDAAHNPDGASALASYIAERGWSASAIVFGAMKDKDIAGMLEPMRELMRSARAVLGVEIDNERAAPAAALEEALGALSPEVGSLAQLWPRLAGVGAQDEAPVVCFGSIYLLGEVLARGGVTTSELTTRRV